MKFRSLVFILCLPVFVLGCVSSGGTRIDNVPMYGQPEVTRPDSLKKADRDFVNEASSGFGSREEASKAWWAQGEKYMREGNLDYAMRRYNQSWLLNPKNYQPYWGFARVMLENRKIDEAIKYLEKAESLINEPYQKVALLADMGSAYTIKGEESPEYFEKANSKFTESTELDSSYSNSWRRWAFSLYEQANYSEAMEKVKKAQSLKARPFLPSFISALESKL